MTPVADSATVSTQADFSVAGDAGSVALAREFTRIFLTRAGYAGSHDDVIVVTSELLTNALRHGRGDVVLRVAGDADRVRLEVSDRSRRGPRRGKSGTDDGWGLMLVAGLSTDWGVDERDAGKVVVWSELHAEPETAANAC